MKKAGQVKLNLNAKNDLINADETHFTNLINNLVDNAVKYSKENLCIVITTHCTTKKFNYTGSGQWHWYEQGNSETYF